MRLTHMKIIPYILLICLLITGSGCMTTHTIKNAKGRSHTNQNGEVVVDKKPEKGYYALVPFAVIGDTALLPVYIIFFGFAGLTGYKG